MSIWLGLVLFLWCMAALILTICEFGVWGGEGDGVYKYLTPIHLHHWTKMNWFGCYASWILLGIVSPVAFVVKLCWFLFHIGKFEDIL